MNKRSWLWCLAIATALVSGTRSWEAWGPKTLCPGFLPENDMRVPVGDASALGINQDDFNKVLDRVEAIYAPIVRAKGGKLVVQRLWEDERVNASANQMFGNWYINMYGGLARHQAVTADGFALVACHEIGHHVGGYPKSRGWATNEGGADYFATLKCLRLVFPGLESGGGETDPLAEAACRKAFETGEDRGGCGRNSMGGLSVTSLFAAMRNLPKKPQFDTPDTTVVDSTNDSHPAAQCRLDTYFQGSLCGKSVSEDLSNSDPAPGACTKEQRYDVGLRPLCWYKPPKSALPGLYLGGHARPEDAS